MKTSTGWIRILNTAVTSLFVSLVILLCVYSFFNSLTLFLWGDPSKHGEPRLFHPPEIMVLHYTSMIFPEFGRLIMTLLYWGCGMFAWLGFHQVTRKTSLNHPIRDQIMCFVRSHPGCHFRSIMRENGINRGTLSYHLDRLTSFGLMREVKDGGLTRYFVHTNEVSELEQKILAHRDNPRRNQILGMLNSDKSTPKTALTNHLKISGPALCYHMQILMGDEIVLEEQDRQKVGRPVRYSLTQNAAKILKNNSKGAQTRAEFNDISTNVPDGNLQTGTDTGVRV